MKRICFIVFIALLLSNSLFSQQGTIKIAKPEKKDSVISKPKYYSLSAGVGTNYTFKKNNKVGYDFECGIFFSPWSTKVGYFVGVKYSFENQYFQLSPFDSKTLQVTNGYSKSQNKTEYIKLPLIIRRWLPLGPSGINFTIGVEPQYCLKNKNDRLLTEDLNPFNLAGNIGIEIPIGKVYLFNFNYSRDFFENLKDRNIYNTAGEITGKQKTKTNLVSVGIKYLIRL